MANSDEYTPLLDEVSENTSTPPTFKWTPIEVVVVLYFMASIIVTTTTQYFVISVIAAEYNETHFINHKATCNETRTNTDIVEEKSSEFLMYFGFCGSLLAVLPLLFLGTVADRYGRKSVMYLCLSGLLIKESIYIIVANFSLSMYWLYLAVIIEGLTGGFGAMAMTFFGMAADITSPGKNRAFRISVIEGTASITAAISILCVGYWIKYGGFYYPILFSCFITILCTVFVTICIPETYTIQTDTGRFFRVENILKWFHLYRDNSQIGRRKKLFISLIIVALSGSAVLGRYSTQILFLLNVPLCWNEVHIQIFACVQTLVNWGAVITFVRILHKFMKDYGILIIGAVSAFASLLLFSFAVKDWLVYIYVAVGMLSSAVFPVVRSLMSRLCTKDEQGSLFASVASTELFFTAISQLMYGGIYKASVSFFPGLVFVIMSCILLLVLVLTIMLYRWMSRPERMTWDVIN